MYLRVYGGYPVVSRPRLANYDDVTRAKWKPRSRQNHNRLSLFSSFLSSWIQVRAKLAPPLNLLFSFCSCLPSWERHLNTSSFPPLFLLSSIIPPPRLHPPLCKISHPLLARHKTFPQILSTGSPPTSHLIFASSTPLPYFSPIISVLHHHHGYEGDSLWRW